MKLILVGIASFLAFVWNKLTVNHIYLTEKKETVLPVNKNKLVSFYNNYIIVDQDGKITVLSAHCSHLGCIINKIENGRLVCPCHGSEYNLQGVVVKGPAYKNLEILHAQLSPDGSNVTIKN